SLHQGLHQPRANRCKPGQPLTRQAVGSSTLTGRTPSPQRQVLTRERAGCHLLTTGPTCRGDWIRTSDLLNPIQAGAPAKTRKVLQFQLLRQSTLSTVYPEFHAWTRFSLQTLQGWRRRCSG